MFQLSTGGPPALSSVSPVLFSSHFPLPTEIPFPNVSLSLLLVRASPWFDILPGCLSRPPLFKFGTRPTTSLRTSVEIVRA